jgi:hypothetical protein
MRHQADDVALLVGYAGDVVQRSVGILTRRVAEYDLAVGLEPLEHVVRRVVATGLMLGGDRQPLPLLARARP